MRNYEDWLGAYCEYACHTEAPRRFHFWSGVSAIAGALRRHVWFSMGYFQWYPNQYILLVAPPGVATKSSTSRLAMELLRKVPGVYFGPDSVTWPKLIQNLSQQTEQFWVGTFLHTQSTVTIHSSEFGNLFDPQDRALVDIFVDLWDSITGPFERATKGDGSIMVENPSLNLIACTTPGWLANYFPESLIEGGFTSRCVFVYASAKEKFIAYPFKHIPANHLVNKEKLAADLCHIADKLVGEYKLTKQADEWGEAWYPEFCKHPPARLKEGRFSTYISRRQTHLHKLAMVLAASARDELIITLDDLRTADQMLTDIEMDMPKVFEKIGRSAEANEAIRFVELIQGHPEGLHYNTVYERMHARFPTLDGFSEMLSAVIKAGYVGTEVRAGGMYIIPGLVKPGG